MTYRSSCNQYFKNVQLTSVKKNLKNFHLKCYHNSDEPRCARYRVTAVSGLIMRIANNP